MSGSRLRRGKRLDFNSFHSRHDDGMMIYIDIETVFYLFPHLDGGLMILFLFDDGLGALLEDVG